MAEEVAELEARLESAADSREKIDVLNDLVWKLRHSDAQRAMALSEEAQRLACEGEFEFYPKGLAESLRNSGWLNLQLSNYDVALTLLLEALALFEDIGDLMGRASALTHVGLVHFSLGNYSQALEVQLEALKISEHLGDKRTEAGALNAIGLVYWQSGDYKAALAHFNRSLQLFQELGDREGEANALNNSGAMYRLLGSYSNALAPGLESLHIYQRMGDQQGEARALTSVGEAHRDLGDYVQALAHFERCVAVCRETGNKHQETYALINIGEIHTRQKETAAALSHLHQALALAEEIESRPQMFEAHRALAEAYRQAGEFERALSHYEQFHAIKEHVFNEQTDSRLKSLQAVHELKVAREEAEIHQLRNVALKQEIEERKKVEDALQRRNRELTALNAVAEALSSSLDLRGVLEQALRRLLGALRFTGGLIALADRGTGALTLFSHTELPQALVEHLQACGMDHMLYDFTYRQGKLLALEDLRSSQQKDVRNLLEVGLQAYVGVPLLYQGRALGLVCLFDTAPHSLSDADRALLTTVSQQISVAVENVRLFGDVVHEREISNTLLNTAEALSTTLRFDVLLERALDELWRVVPYDTASISMLRDEWWWIVAARGREQPFTRRFDVKEMPLVHRVVRQRTPVVVPDVRQEPDWVLIEGTEAIRSWLGAPLIARNVVIGVLMVNSYHPNMYDVEAARLASAFAHQVALAIENARLYEQGRSKLHEVSLLHSVTMALSSTLDMRQMLPYVARILCEILNGDCVEIDTLDQETGMAAAAANYVASEGADGEVYVVPDRQYTLADMPVLAEFLAQREPWQVRLDDPEADPRLRALLESSGAQATLLLPMTVGDRVLGFSQVRDSQSPRRFTNGEIATAQMVVHQATIALDNARLVEALRRQTAELQARNEELDAFAHTVAHDLKGPLGYITGYAFLLEDDRVPISSDEQREYIRAISQGAQKMSNIISELLLLASVRRMAEINIGPVDMGYVVGEVQKRLSYTMDEQQAEVVWPEAWPTALGYGPWIEEVWANYISNAMKYGGQPPRVELGAAVQADGMVRFWVRDNGHGLTPEERARLFTPFTRLDQARAKGHGLGLSIVRRIVEKLGGQVDVESEVGQGSVFSFTLPGVSG